MALCITQPTGVRYADGALFVHYLSTDVKKTLVDDGVFGASFSPDGSKVAFAFNKKLMTADIDGGNRQELCDVRDTPNSKEPQVQWCTDGYIYFAQCDENIYRVPENGGSREIFHTLETHTSESGAVMGRAAHNFCMTLSGKRAVWTNPPPGLRGNGWHNITYDSDTQEEYLISGGCQSTISPDGETVVRSNWDHINIYFLPWNMPDVVTDEWNDTYSGCSDNLEDYSCPQYLKTIQTANDFPHWIDHWPQHMDSVLCYTSEEENIGYVHNHYTGEITNIGEGVVFDFYPAEITSPDQAGGFELSPKDLVYTIETGALTGISKTTTVTNNAAGTTLGTVSVSGAPAWLSVAVNGTGNNQSIISTVIPAQLPATGTYSATLIVSAAGEAAQASYTATLNVTEPFVNPITIVTPAGGASYTVGSTLTVHFSAECNAVPSVVLWLSLDDGENWTKMHRDGSKPCGEDRDFQFVLPDSIYVLKPTGGSNVSVVSKTCRVRINNYSGGETAVSELFTIAPADAAVNGEIQADFMHRGVQLDSRPSGFSLTLSNSGNFTVQVTNCLGRLFAQEHVTAQSSSHTLSYHNLAPGMYTVQISRNGVSHWTGRAIVGN